MYSPALRIRALQHHDAVLLWTQLLQPLQPPPQSGADQHWSQLKIFKAETRGRKYIYLMYCWYKTRL